MAVAEAVAVLVAPAGAVAVGVAEGVEVQPQWRPFKDHARTWLNSRALPRDLVDVDMPGTWFAQQAVQYLQENKSEPFFLMVSFTEPHSPFHFPVEFRGRHRAGTGFR